jgi:hypothetical protein
VVETWAQGVVDALGALGAALVLDAAQWADPWTLRVCDAAMSGAYGAPPRLCVAGRWQEQPPELGALLDAVERHGGVERVRLDALRAETVEEAVAQRMTNEEAAEALATWLRATAGGLPDLLQAAAGALWREGILHAAGQGWRLQVQRLRDEYPPGSVPRAVAQIARRRLAELDRGAREVLQICGAAGGAVTLTSLDNALGPGTAEALDDLVARQLVVDESDEWGAQYRPAAAALGQAALSMMGGASRERLLERVGVR